jgi:hypothetical protein
LAEQKIKLTPRDPLPFRTDRVESLQQSGADQSLRRKGVPTQERIGRVKGSRKISQRAIRGAAHDPQREVGTLPLFTINMAGSGTSHRSIATHGNLDRIRRQSCINAAIGR